MNSYLLGIELRLFWSATLLYAIGLLLFILQTVMRMDILGKAAKALVFSGLLTGILQLSLRTFETGRFPVHTLHETLAWFALGTVAVYLYSTRRWNGVYLPGIMVSLISSGACFYALTVSTPAIEPLSPMLQSGWFAFHRFCLFFSYALFSVSASVELSYLVLSSLAKKSGRRVYGLTAAELYTFHSSAFRLVLAAYPFLTLSIFSGGVWADATFGRYWSWDANQNWTLITWTLFTVYLHARRVPALSGRTASAFNIFGFASILLATFLGANWLATLFGIPVVRLFDF